MKITEILRSKKLPSGTRAHGIDYSKKYNHFYIVGSYLDAVLVIDDKFNLVDKIKISDKFEKTGKPSHHCNDCCLIDNKFVSMFCQMEIGN